MNRKIENLKRFIFVYKCFFPTCMKVHHVLAVSLKAREGIRALELELKVVVCHFADARN